MESYDVVVVGAGPAGSACAHRLKANGASVLLIDRAGFPRTKLCAGWITPAVLSDLRLDPADYPHRFNTFEHIVVHLKWFTFRLPSVQHSIRRFEFDDFLRRRSEAEFRVHNAKRVSREGGDYVIDGLFRAKFVVGAGGTRCPVYRTFFRDANPRARELQAATYEYEFPYAWEDRRCHLWFFDGGLPGYSWYVPKADGYLNCGIGGMAEQLKSRGDDIKRHWRALVSKLERSGLVGGVDYEPKGYSYYLRGGVERVRADNAFIVGDAVGLATRDLCEGIGPAIRSGQRAAESILHGADYMLSDLPSHSSEHVIVRKLLDFMFARA